MLNNKLYLLLSLSLALISCDRSGVYEEDINTENNSWTDDNIAKFGVNISDTVLYHNLYINIRNTTDYQNSNLFLFITTKSPAGFSQTDTLECFLADEFGNWLGKGVGYLRDNQVPFKRNIRFPQKGLYKFEVMQAMRIDELKGIASVGIRVEKSNVK